MMGWGRSFWFQRAVGNATSPLQPQFSALFRVSDGVGAKERGIQTNAHDGPLHDQPHRVGMQGLRGDPSVVVDT